MLARLGLIIFILALAGCSNMVMSDRPLITDSEADLAPLIRAGLWLADDPRCRVNADRPVERWPHCAARYFVRGRQFLSYPRFKGEDRKTAEPADLEWGVTDFRLSAGDPIIFQIAGCLTAPAEADGTPDAEAAPDKTMAATNGPVETSALPDASSVTYCYFGARILSRDAAGRATAAEFWPILCGPVSEKGENDASDHPWPGVTIVDRDCTVPDEASLREAARLSESLSRKDGSPPRIAWVRDNYR